MLAVCTIGGGRVELREVTIPHPAPGQVKIKVVACAQNPADWKTVMYHDKPGCIVGCDFAGIVVELGEGVKEHQTFVGDRVASFVHGAVRANGSFAEFLVCPAHILIKIPETWSFEMAAQIPIACFTASQCLYQLQDPPTSDNPTRTPLDILIWGGSTNVGHYTIQLAQLGGMRVISTSSPKHFESVRALGATDVFDYRNPKAGQKIRARTNEGLSRAVDCVSEATTPFQVSNSLGPSGGTISIVNPYTSRKQGVKTIFSLAYTLLGDEFEFPQSYKPVSEDIGFGAKATKIITRLLAEDAIVPTPIKIMPHGLASVSDGLEYMRAGRASYEKIVYRVSDTPGILI